MEEHKSKATLSTMMLVNIINFGLVMFWSFDGAVMLPYLQVRFGIENDVGAWIVGIGKFMIAISLFFGLFSDLSQTSWGKRRPWMLLGGLISAPMIALIPHMPTPLMLVVVLTIAYFGIQFAAVPYFSLVPEVIPNEKLATANAFFSAFGGVGTLIAYVALFSIVYTVNKILAFHILAAVVLLGTLVTVFTIREYIPEPPFEKHNRLRAMFMSIGEIARDMPKYKSLAIFLISNLFFWLGLGVFVQFFTKFMEYYANVPNKPAGFVLGAIVVVSVVLAVPVGIIGDKVSRKALTFAGMIIIFAGLTAGYFLVGPNSAVSGLDLSSATVVNKLAAEKRLDMTGADLSLFVKMPFEKPADINGDKLNDKCSDVLHWCLNGELDDKNCDKAVTIVMGKGNPARAATKNALLKIRKHVNKKTGDVSDLDLSDIAVVERIAAENHIDMSKTDLSLFVKKPIKQPADINGDELNDKRADALRWCLNGELDAKRCDRAVTAVMGKDNPARPATKTALLKISKFVDDETTKVLNSARLVIAFAAIGLVICFVIMATILPTLMPEEKMGLYMGFYSTVTGFGQFLSVTIAGIMIQRTLDRGMESLGYRWMFVQGAACLLIAAIALLCVPYIPRANQPTVTEMMRKGNK